MKQPQGLARVCNTIDLAVVLTREGWVRAPGVSSTWQRTWSAHPLRSTATGSGSEWLLAAVFVSCASVFAAVEL
jgi:hypothetical protein